MKDKSDDDDLMKMINWIVWTTRDGSKELWIREDRRYEKKHIWSWI